MSLTFSIPTTAGAQESTVEPGSSLYFVGANGGGKTRLSVRIEEVLGERAHRISAHRALALNPGVPKIGEDAALRGLKYGRIDTAASVVNRGGFRWHNKGAVDLLNDYDFLLQALFAEQANTALLTHNSVRAGHSAPASQTKFEKLIEIWDRILPHRVLEISGDNINVKSATGGNTYHASEMSDGERATFYLIGQTLVTAANSLIIFDEPELHLHRAIMSRLWDELEAARPDCAMVVISHDLEFVAARRGQKFILKDYQPPNWIIEVLPEETEFPEEVASIILGSRRPILFVEGTRSSLDYAIFRACYPDWTIIPRGSCEEVIHAVMSMRANAQLTRISCAGIVDGDDYTHEEVDHLAALGIAVLPVSEIENIFLLPDVIGAVAAIEGHKRPSLNTLIDQILVELFQHASEPGNQRASILRYGRRRIDRMLKKVDLSTATDVATLAATYAANTTALDVAAIAQTAEDAINAAIAAQDAAALLKCYNNKGLLSIACKAKGCNQKKFEEWVVRTLRNGSVPALSATLRKHLPNITAR